MELKKVSLENKGMVQDTSISKNSHEYAFENHNIRIISNDDHTSMSITNVQGPRATNIQLKGIVLGKCVLDEYIVVFTHEQNNSATPDRIYRIDLKNSPFISNILFEGNLNFNEDYLIDSIYYIENLNVIKVYWTDGLNHPRFINIITEGERTEQNKTFTPYINGDIFDFYPNISKTPKISLCKLYGQLSALANGVILYYISYYNSNGAETLIASTSSQITTDYIDRGAKGDDLAGNCVVVLNIDNIDTNFDFIRIYSAIRTSELSELNVNIVRDVKINALSSLQIIDDGYNLESLDPTQLFYIGGQPLLAKTISLKDNTLFLGNLKKSFVQIPNDVLLHIESSILSLNSDTILDKNSIIKSPFVFFNQDKQILSYDSKNKYYLYNRQVFLEASTYKTFKSKEIYRFGILFLTIKGEWSEVVWVGDVECDKRPTINDDGTVYLNNACFNSKNLFTSGILKSLKDIGIVNYRLLIADPVKHNGRRIKALGVLCPTLFNLKERCLGKYVLPSWIMRPRNNSASYHHLEPLVDYTSDGAEIVTLYTENYPSVSFERGNDAGKTYVGITYIPSFEDGKVYVKYVEFKTDFISQNCYDYFGKTSCEAVREECFEDDFDLKGLIEYVGEKESFKIPSNAFETLRNKQLTSFFINLAIAIGAVLVSVFTGVYGGAALVSAISTILPMVYAGAVGLTQALLISAIAAGTFFISNESPILYTPNFNDLQLKELLGGTFGQLEDYQKEFISKGCMFYPLTNNSKMDNINLVPMLTKIDGIFSDTLKTYPVVEYIDKKEVIGNYSCSTLPSIFKPSYGNADAVYFLLYEKMDLEGINLNINTDYFVDESVLTFHSPEINENSILDEQYKCNIIGYVPLETNNYVTALMEMSPAPYGEYGGINNSYISKLNTDFSTYSPFYSGDLYYDVDILNSNLYLNYKCFLFGPANIVGGSTEQLEGKEKSILKYKKILNHSYSKNTIYFNNDLIDKLYDSYVGLFTENPILLKNTPEELPLTLYLGNYSNAYIVKDMKHLPSSFTSDEMINISYNSTPHAVLTLKDENARIPLLPIIGKNNKNTYLSLKDGKINDYSLWTQNVFKKERELILNLRSDNLCYVEYPCIDKRNFLFDEIGGIFVGDLNAWQPYANLYDAMKVKFLYVKGRDTAEDLYSVSTWLNPTFFNNALELSVNKWEYPSTPAHWYLFICNGYLTKYYDNCGVFTYHILRCCRHAAIYQTIYGQPSVRFTEATLFLLGLLYYFGSNEVLHDYYNDTYFDFNIPESVKNDLDFMKYVEQFRDEFKKLWYYTSMYKRCLINELYKYIQKEILSIENNLKNILNNIALLYCVNIDEYWDKYFDYLKNNNYDGSYFKDISYATIYNSDGTVSTKDDLPQRCILALLFYNDNDEKTGEITSDRFIERIFESICTSCKEYIQAKEDEEDEEFGFKYTYNSNNYSHYFDFKVEDKIYLFVNNQGTITIQEPTNNIKSLYYKGITYSYDSVAKLLIEEETPDLYFLDEIDYTEPTKPYLMLAELYSDIPYSSLYGGHSESDLKKLTWIPVSDSYEIGLDITNSFGDTYYLRWDCLKTYPTTDEDMNQNIDITSFMVESHINLDDRTDVNRGNFNLISRPSNFNLFNNVYNSQNDVFIYQTNTSELNTKHYPNLFVWSLSKNYLGSVDNWTNISFASLNLCKNPITKICNFNNKLICLNTKSIEFIDFNTKNFVPTDNGFIELQNSNKVTGTIDFSNIIGTNNMSIQITESGLYFVEDNEHNIIRINNDGQVFRIGVSRMESWMKQNIGKGDYNFNTQGNIHLEYDFINKELHILNDKYCLVYNELLESFTAFLDLQETVFMFPFNGNTWSLGNINNSTLYLMYDGLYNTGYNGATYNYSVHYRVNPEGIGDKVFTNILFVADVDVNDSNSNKNSNLPFTHIQAWNEYLDTTKKPLIFNRHNVSNLKQKFRIWRADIPRHGTALYGGDRMRNPWIHLLLEKDASPNNYKMEMHNLEVQYMS